MAISTSSDRSIESGDDSVDPASQRRPDRTTSSATEHSTHGANDSNRDDNVLERHDTVLVRAQTLQSFPGLNVILQHRRNPFVGKIHLHTRRHTKPLSTRSLLLFGLKIVT